MSGLTGKRHESFVLSLQPPLEDAHILVEGEGLSLSLQRQHTAIVEQGLVDVGMSLGRGGGGIAQVL